MTKGGFVNQGRCQYVYREDYQTPEQQLEELWDEVIDYLLALRSIAAYSAGTQSRIAAIALAKHGKTEEPEQT